MKIKLDRIDTNFDAKTNRCWVQARGGISPDGFAIITTQPLRLTGSDIFYGLSCFFSEDNGRTWRGPVEQAGLRRRPMGDGMEIAICDGTPTYHAQSGKMLLTGHTVIYDNDEIVDDPRPRHTAYSVFNDVEQCWSEFKLLEMPEAESTFFSCGSGSGQRVDLDDGSILLPVYYMSPQEARSPWESCFRATVVRCSFDGQDLEYLEHGNSLSVPEPRGLYEPSLCQFAGRYYLTLRNDVKGYVADSDDGLNFNPPKPWCFDDGEEIGNYCTQQHWLSIGDKLYLVYTRKGENNDHVFRHRAPLFIAQVDTENLCLIRETEQVVIPERGARLGNFGCLQVAADEAWVVASEWMQNELGQSGVEHCQKHGSDNSIFIAKITASKTGKSFTLKKSLPSVLKRNLQAVSYPSLL
jgi:hypothetical protein